MGLLQRIKPWELHSMTSLQLLEMAFCVCAADTDSEAGFLCSSFLPSHPLFPLFLRLYLQ